MSDFLSDVDWVNEEYAMDFLPPTIQWRRGDLTNRNPLIKNGCWQFPADSFDTMLSGQYESVDVIHAGGEVVRSYLMETIHVALLAYKKRWYITDTDGNMSYIDGYQEGAKSKLQWYALVKELGNEAALISVSGLNAKHLSEAVFSFEQKVLRPAMQAAKKRFARYHFWLPLSTAGKITAPQNQYITPPQMAIEELSLDKVRSLFTGREVAQAAEELMPAAKAWAMPQPKPTEQMSVVDVYAPPPPPPPPVDMFDGDELEQYFPSNRGAYDTKYN